MGRILMIEFDEQEIPVFEEIMRALKQHPSLVFYFTEIVKRS